MTSSETCVRPAYTENATNGTLIQMTTMPATRKNVHGFESQS